MISKNVVWVLCLVGLSGPTEGQKPDWLLVEQALKQKARENKPLLNVVHYPQEVHLANVKQMTFGGMSAEAYFSFDNSQFVFQSSGTFDSGDCDQIYQFHFKDGNMAKTPPRLVSSGYGATTCSYFLPGDKKILYAATWHPPTNTAQGCPKKACDKNLTGNALLTKLCDHEYTWNIFPGFNIYEFDPAHPYTLKTLVDNPNVYDAEGTVSPKGDKIVYTSMKSGDLELWTMNIDGSNQTMVTDRLGYDGGAFFSPDGKKLIFRASTLKTAKDNQTYKELLKYNLVSPTKMELFVVNADGSNLRQITHLGEANWCPFYHHDNKRIIFGSNYHNNQGGFNFNLFLIGEDGTGLKQITYDPNFDGFPMYSFDGKRLLFASTRNGSKPHEINIFVADWVENPSSAGLVRIDFILLFASIMSLLAFQTELV